VAAGIAWRALTTRRPERRSMEQRLAMVATAAAPLGAPVTIRWNSRQVPIVEAHSDNDLATGLGIVHAHLRLAQMELMRRVAHARIAETIGPLGIPLDRTILLMDLAHAVPAIQAMMPPDTLAWVEAFIRGINHQIAGTRELPYELRLLRIRPEPWTLAEFLTLSRLYCADVSWMIAARLLRARALSGDHWPTVWPRLLAGGAPGAFDEPGHPEASALSRGMRAGSNSAAIAGRLTAGGHAMIASDPHLGLSLPSPWLIAGMRSPGMHCVGLMLAGMPFVALGRNRHIAWGGTSLHAASSELVDVSSLPANGFSERVVTIKVRGAKPRALRLRTTRFGPVVTDGMLVRADRPLSLSWVGHRQSDEITAMLGVARAETFAQFNTALDGFAVPGQTMIFASAPGGVGRRVAAHMPRRPQALPDDIFVSPGNAWDMDDSAQGPDMPRSSDPADGIVASANDQPAPGAVTLGFFFASGDRAARLRALLTCDRPVTEADLHALQRDTYHARALAMRDSLLPALAGVDQDFVAMFASWDGTYAPGSTGALAYELLLGALVPALLSDASWAPYQAVWTTRLLLAEDIARLSPDDLRRAVRRVLPRVLRLRKRFGTWGHVHRYHPGHYFSALPCIGRRFRLPPFPAAGGGDSLLKTGHGLVSGIHNVSFGSGARHVSDLADQDANRFVLFGGQDGWLGSANFADQLPLWRDGRTMTVPMSEGAALRDFTHCTTLRPA
jgi:penicillin amidase